MFLYKWRHAVLLNNQCLHTSCHLVVHVLTHDRTSICAEFVQTCISQHGDDLCLAVWVDLNRMCSSTDHPLIAMLCLPCVCLQAKFEHRKRAPGSLPADSQTIVTDDG